ncbi:hypothetical protein Gohar_025622, partial [Gossypium harknessii]|nr:hypothetical protein [Gossypium harknessii]
MGYQKHTEGTWVHLFSDGAVERATGNASVRGVICDQAGNWILGYNRYLDSCTPFEAKLWGYQQGRRTGIGVTSIHPCGRRAIKEKDGRRPSHALLSANLLGAHSPHVATFTNKSQGDPPTNKTLPSGTSIPYIKAYWRQIHEHKNTLSFHLPL